jgi:hypothetical protein
VSVVAARSGPTKKVSSSPYPSGAGPGSPDLSGEGSASPDPYEYARPRVGTWAPVLGPCRTLTTPDVVAHDPNVRREG